MTPPTKAQKIERAQRWVTALQNNKRKAVEEMKDNKGGRCCLAVAQDVAIKVGGICLIDPSNLMPEGETIKWFGWGPSTPLLRTPNGATIDASELNDGTNGIKPLTHKQIAECVIATFINPDHRFTFQLEKL